MNLIINAAQAIEGHGDIWIRTKETDSSIRVEVEDNGSGIDDEVKHKLFDPFFTTKPVGVGTGLGLSITHGIIEKHNASINVESTVGVGTKFIIEFPLG